VFSVVNNIREYIQKYFKLLKVALGDLTMKKIKILKTLDEKTFAWLEVRKTSKVPGRQFEEGLKLGSKRYRYYYIRKVARKEIEDLTRLAKLLDEDQLSQIFNIERLREFFRALFHLDIELEKDPELLKKKRLRLLPLCYEIITLLDDFNFAYLMAPMYSAVTRKEGGSLPNLRAIYYRSLIQNVEELKE
jgi:hypothetical protein